MFLKSFGCSIIFGSDLADDGFKNLRPTPSQHTWPALIAKKLSVKYECFARPGAGNLQIMEQVLNQIAAPQPAVFVIGWSWIDRFDYYDVHWNRRLVLSPWKTIMPIDEHNLAKTYYRELHSEYRDKLVNLNYIRTTIDSLKQRQIPFVMTYMDDLLFDSRWHVSPAVSELQSYVKPYMTLFEGKTFLEFSKSKGFEISEKLHPLETAHAAACETIWPFFDKQKINDLVQQAHV